MPRRLLTPVVIGSHPDRTAWLDDCLKSIRATSSPRRKILVHHTGGYEPAALKTGCAAFDRFLFIHDSVTILHPDFWEVIDSSGPCWLAGAPHMHLGIYDSADLEPLLPEHEVDKGGAIRSENDLPQQLPRMRPLWPEILDIQMLRREVRHGRDNLVLGNHMWEKHKGNWGQL